MNTKETLKQLLTPNRGMTLVELLVSLVIFGVVVTGIWSSFNSQNRIYHSQQQVAMIQQNIRAAMYVMEKQLRMAGYDPDNNGYGISSISDNAITFNYDDNIGGAISRKFWVNGSNLRMGVDGDVDDDGDALAENIYDSGAIKGFAIAYAFDNDGDNRLDTEDGSPGGNIIWAVDSDNNNALDLHLDTNMDGAIDAGDEGTGDGIIDGVVLNPQIPLTAIRAVRIWVLAEADAPDPYYKDNRTYVVGRNVITTNDRMRKMLLTSIVKCRNL